MKPVLPKTILGQPSWAFSSDCISAYLTEIGGHLGPVRFKLGKRVIEPFSVAPWAEEDADTIPLLKSLRGDFFCCPFGGNETPWRGERHPPHGESASSRWKLTAILRRSGSVFLQASMTTTARRGRIVKTIVMPAGQSVIYQQHEMHGFTGPMCVGHHPMIRFPDEQGSGLISVSRFVHGQVYPGTFESPESKGYQSLKPGARFTSLDRVPMIDGGYADLSRYPARRGFEDLVMMCADPKLPFAWSAVVFPKQRYVWFSLRNPRVLRNTVFWISNGGRHYAPWSGRHINVMGIEDTTSYFHEGLASSVQKNSLNKRGIPTTITLNPKKPTAIGHIMGVLPIPAGFDHVADIQRISGGIRLISRSGKRVDGAMHLDFLKS